MHLSEIFLQATYGRRTSEVSAPHFVHLKSRHRMSQNRLQKNYTTGVIFVQGTKLAQDMVAV